MEDAPKPDTAEPVAEANGTTQPEESDAAKPAEASKDKEADKPVEEDSKPEVGPAVLGASVVSDTSSRP